MDKTLNLLAKSLKRSPEDWETRKHLIDTYVEKGDMAGAVDLVRSAPNVPEEDEDLIGVTNFLGPLDPFAALGFAERAFMADQQRGASHLAKAIACDFISQPEAAEQHKANALQLNPGLAQFLATEESAVVPPAPDASFVPPAPDVPPAPVAPEAAEAAETVEAVEVVETAEATEVYEAVEAVEATPVEAVEAVEAVEEHHFVEEHDPAPYHYQEQAEESPQPAVAVDFNNTTSIPTIAPLVNPNVIPEPLPLLVEEVAPEADLTYTTQDELEVTRSHLLVPAGDGEFVDADQIAVTGPEDAEENPLTVAPPGFVPTAAEQNKNKARLSAILLTTVIHIVIFALIGLVIIAAPRILPPEIVAATVPVSENETITKKQVVQQSPPKKVSPPAPAVSAIASMAATSAVSIPEVDFQVDTAMDVSSSFGANMSFGAMSGGMGSGVPFTMKSRCSATERAALLRKHGGNAKVASSVKKSLKFLQGQQNEDGSWGDHHKAAMTGFALLSYLGHCETPDSPEYGDTVMNGILYLVELGERNEGVFRAVQDHHFPYEHGIATYALGETYALAKYGKRQLPGVRKAFEKGVKIIVDGQLGDGGWRYGYGLSGAGDTSVTGWQYQALKAAKHTNLKIGGLESAIGDAIDYFQTVRKDQKDLKSGYMYSRSRNEATTSMTAAVALGYQLLGDREKDEYQAEIDGAVEHLIAKIDSHEYSKRGSTLYDWYYLTQVYFQKGGDAWDKWNDMFREDMIKAQESDGSWPPVGANSNRAKSPQDKIIYRQCLNTLMLEVYYRYLPAAG